MALSIVMSFLCELVSWDKQNLRLSKLLREAEFLFVAWRKIGFTLQEMLSSIVMARFMCPTRVSLIKMEV